MENIEGGNEMEIFKELVKRAPDFLTRPIEELIPMSYVGTPAVNFACALNKKIDKLNLSVEQKDRWQKDAQEMGDIVLDIKGQIGRLLPPAEEMYKTAIPIQEKNGVKEKKMGGNKKTLPEGLDSREAYISRQIAKHPKIVEKVKQQARKEKDIPTTRRVLTEIAYESMKEKGGENKKKLEMVMRGEAMQYLLKIQRAVLIIPSEPPKDLTEEEFIEIQNTVYSLLHRVRYFLGGEYGKETTETKSISGPSS